MLEAIKSRDYSKQYLKHWAGMKELPKKQEADVKVLLY